MKTQRKGFGIVEVIIIIAVVAVVAGLGWYAQSSKQRQQSTSTSPTPVGSSSTPTTTPTASPESVLSITQWGVKFPYNNKPEGLTYKIEADNGSERVLFGSDELKKYANARDSGNWCDNGSLGLVSRSTSNTSQGDAATNFNGLVAHVGEYYYLYTHTQQACSLNTEIQAEQVKQQAQLIVLLKYLKQ